MLAKKNEDIKKAYDILKIVSQDEKARMVYEVREAEIKDQLTRIKSAREEGIEKLRNAYKNCLQFIFNSNSQSSSLFVFLGRLI